MQKVVDILYLSNYTHVGLEAIGEIRMADEKKFEVPGVVSIVTTRKQAPASEPEQRITEPQSTGITVAEIYDRYSRLLYVIDSSTSMGDGMLPGDRADLYLWPESTLQKFREAMDDEDLQDVDLDAEYEDEDYDSDDEPDFVIGANAPSKMSDQDLKDYIVDNDLGVKYGIPLKINPNYRPKGRSKMQAVKEAARDFVSKRYQRYPDAFVTLYTFNELPRLLSVGNTEQAVLSGIDSLPDHGKGGTDIFAAVRKSLDDIIAKPSKVNRNHIILVSDGLDSGAKAVKEMLPQMKENGVVFDFIFIQGTSKMEVIPQDVLDTLKLICEMTGGEFQIVKTEKDFTQKFLAASNRPMLPAARGN